MDEGTFYLGYREPEPLIKTLGAGICGNHGKGDGNTTLCGLVDDPLNDGGADP